MGSWFRIVAAAVAMSAGGGGGAAQSPFPSKPVHIFVPYAAGGGVDILARTLGDVVSRQWGQTVIVENRPGAGGVVASPAVAPQIRSCTLKFPTTPSTTSRRFRCWPRLPISCWCAPILRSRHSLI